MANSKPTTQFRFWLWLITFIGVIVPRRLRANWRREWESELRHREELLARWDRLDWRNKLDLLRRSASAFWDALWLQPKRLEDEMFQDLRFGARMLLKHKGLTLIAALTLSLGIGANTAIFSLANALLLRSLPVPQPERIVHVSRDDGMGEPLSYPDFVALRARNEVLSGLAAAHFAELSFGNGSRSEMLRGELVSSDYFDVLGVRPALGRGFLPEEERAPGAHPVVILSHGIWQSRFSGDPQIAGRTITLNRKTYTVIGVAPEGFSGMVEMFRTDLWMPLMMLPQARPMFRDSLSRRDDQLFAAIGRLKHGVSLVQAQTALETINQSLDRAEPPPAFRQGEDRSLKLERPQGIGLPHYRRRIRIATTFLFAVVGIVLLIACANVANLLLARAAARRKEIAVRLALGASRFRLVRQFLTESAMLGLLGAGAGLLFAFWINCALMALKPPLPEAWGFRLDLQLDATVLGFTLSLALLVSLLVGLAPALAASKPNVVHTLKDETGGQAGSGFFRRFNLRNALVVAQLAVSLVLLITAGLFIRSLQQMHKVDPGFQTENRLALSFNLEQEGYDEARGRDFSQRLVERVRAVPGVQSATMTNFLPLGFMALAEPVTIEGRAAPPDAEPTMAAAQIIGLDYFRTIGARLVRGRDFAPQDSANAPGVAIINETMARRFFANEDPIGKRLRIGGAQFNPQQREIVGIVKDTVVRSIGEVPGPVTYRPLAQQHSSFLTLVVHTAGNPKDLLPAVRREVGALDENLPAQEIKTLEEIVAFSFWPMRMGAGLVGAFGALGLTLAGIGLYGVMSYAVAGRTREIGVRMALGAVRRDVLRLIVGQGMTLAIIGVGAGLALSFAATRVLRRFLFGIGATDPPTFIGVALSLTLIALLACWLPARRATKVDPLVALRHD
jgi:putative ABC transport system permease protein